MAGPWEKYRSGTTGIPIGPQVDPMQVRTQNRQDSTENRNAVNDAQKNRIDQEKLIIDQQKLVQDQIAMQAELAKNGMRLGPNGIEPDPNYQPPQTAAQIGEQRGQTSRLNQLIAQINRTQELFDAGPGATKGASALLDYLPTDANERFDKAGAALAQQGLAAFRVPGTGTVSDRDAEMFDRANLPTASTRDAGVEEQLRGLRSRVEQEMQTLGMPAPQWRGAMDQTFVIDQQQRAAPMGSTQGAQQLPPEMQAAHQAYIRANAGRMNPDDYANFMTSLHEQYGIQPATPDEYRDFARRASQPGVTVNPDIPNPSRPLSGADQIRNNMINNPAGAFGAGLADAGGFGVISALAGDRMNALGDASTGNAIGMGLGQVAGAIGGTSALGKLAGKGVSRIAPNLLGGGGRGQFARNLATDAAYSGIYGGVTGGDPLSNAAMGVAGSAGGQAVGKGLGALTRGVGGSSAVQALRQRGIPLTVGQGLGGRFKSIEDALTSMPFVGDTINARRLEGLRGFNREAMNEAGKPIGATVSNIGEQGTAGLFDQISNSYDNATAGVSVPLDPQFNTDLGNVAMASRRLPPDHQSRFATAMDNRVGPIAAAGEMTGDAYQQAMRGLKGYRSSAAQAAPGFEGDYREALSLAMDSLTNQMTRGGGSKVTKGLKASDEAYKKAKTLQKAIEAAKNGSGSGEIQVFTPAQLNTAATQAARKFGGQRPMAELIDQGQTVLPSRIPDSGTTGRALTSLLAGSVAGGGAGYATGGADGAMNGALLGGAAMAAGSRPAQDLALKVLMDRPEFLRMLGSQIEKRRGLLGSATLPFLIQ
jgi:hypothetical protein